MNFSLTEEQQALKDSARQFLADVCSPEQVRAQMVTPRGHDPEVWQKMATELCWTAVMIPEQYDGFGLGVVALVALMEEFGRSLACSPFFSTVCLATPALLYGATDAQKARWLPDIAMGTTTATLAWSEQRALPVPEEIAAVAKPVSDGWCVTGTKMFVVDGHTADVLIVAARREGSTGEDGVELFVLPDGASNLKRERLPTMDQTRRLAKLTLDGVIVPEENRLPGGWEALQNTLNLAMIALAAEQVGVAERSLDMAVEYAKVRQQFNRPIGSFQSIKHKCAQMLLWVESARSASLYAGWVATEAPEELASAAAMARAYCSDASFRCAAENIQIHGGIGFTWEHDAHLYFKRAKSASTLFGPASFHREQLAKMIL